MKHFITALIFIALAFNALAQTGLTIRKPSYPFSYPGSYMCLTRFDGNTKPLKPLEIHHVGGKGVIDLFRVELLKDGMAASECQYIMYPEKYVIKKGTDSVEICFQSPEIIRFRSTNCGIRLSIKHRGQFMPKNESQARILTYDLRKYYKYMLTTLNSKMIPAKTQPDEPMMFYKNLALDFVPASGNTAEFVLEEYISEWQPKEYTPNFEQCIQNASESFLYLASKLPPTDKQYRQSALEAIYLNWSHTVGKRQFVTREAIYMSKTWMPHIWSWDHCFNAIAMSYFDPQMAWNNLMVMFDNQDSIGCLPDAIDDYSCDWLATKVPIHGWTLKQMMKRGNVSHDMLAEIYQPLCKWTNFYMNYRDDNHNGIPQQNHGNEAADNATVYDRGVPIEAPDLCAHLILQMDVLAEIAEKLGKHEESVQWKDRADKLQGLLIAELWNGSNFVYRISENNEVVNRPACFLSYMPIVISYRLPPEINKKLLQGIEKHIVVPSGIASEGPESEYYSADSYWRGPVWAPVVHLIVTGIAGAGDEKLAARVAEAFCNTVNNSGFHENFDAQTGKGLRDPSYTWTSSAFLALLFEYGKQ